MSNFDKVPFGAGMRRMFYAVTPNETSFDSVDKVPHVIEEATPFFWMFMMLELTISLVKQDHKYRLSDAFTSIGAGMFSRLPMVLVRSITLHGYAWVYENYRLMELPWDSPYTWWITFVGVDLGYYWFHRLAHEVNFMWAAHQVHHSSEDYNLSTALRQSALQHYTSWVFYLPMALCIPPQIFIVHQELNVAYQFWIHTEYIGSLGPLEYILNTPSHHRVHHGRNPYCIDKNYAGVLIIWDRIFGTFEAEDEKVAYGLTHPLNSFEPFYIQFGYIKYLLGRFVDLGGIFNRVLVLFCGPGWAPGKPRTGELADIPQVESPVQRYYVSLPRWLSVYIFIHFTVFSICYTELMARHSTLSQTSVLIFLAYCFFNLTCFGRLCDNSPYCTVLELLRCGMFLVGDMAMSQLGFYGDKGSRPMMMYAFQGLFALSIGICIARIMGMSGENSNKTSVKKES